LAFPGRPDDILDLDQQTIPCLLTDRLRRLPANDRSNKGFALVDPVAGEAANRRSVPSMDNPNSKPGMEDIHSTTRSRIDITVGRWADHFSAVPALLRFAVALLLVALVALLDGMTGPEIGISIFYIVPVSFAAGFLSHRAGLAIAVLSAAAWVYLDITDGRGYSVAWIPYWNSVVRLGFFLLTAELIHRLRMAHARVRAMSRTDPLTGIANATAFFEQAGRIIALSRRNGREFTMVYIDLDRFKAVNDAYGHFEGDRLLRRVAKHIKAHLRTTDSLARLGGDEFGILLPETGTEHARVLLERIASALAREVGHRWNVGATFGAVTFSSPPESVAHAVRQADALMYLGKEDGRGRILLQTWPDSAG
jgi:diguanylate cyclase (GGDEF)-like protein